MEPINREDAFGRIALVATSQLWALQIGLARKLKAEFGSQIHLYCAGPQEVEFYRARNQDDVFASIQDAEILLTACRAPVTDPAAVIDTARRHEERVGETYNRIVMANRHLGRGYALGGFYNSRSRQSESTTYVQMVNALNHLLAFWDRELKQKCITLVINPPKAVFGLARTLGIPARTVAGSRYKNFHYWAHNEYFATPEILQAYDQARAGAVAHIQEPYKSHMDLRKQYMKSMGFAQLIGNLGLTATRHLYWRARGYHKGRVLFLSDQLRFHVRAWRTYRHLTGKAVTPLADMEGKPFVFFPLHTEPETALQQASPEYFFQLGAIASIARDLPAGYLLAVKETYQNFGRRPDNFYDQIREFKNVVLLDMLELGLDVVRKAEAVVTITGTAGFEAAVMGKPVITFGRHNIYNFLPHVMVVRTEEELAGCLRKALSDEIDKARIAADGARFLDAVLACSFDMADFDYRTPDRIGEAVVEAAFNKLVEGLLPRTLSAGAVVENGIAAGKET